jgi:hypothetical protein
MQSANPFFDKNDLILRFLISDIHTHIHCKIGTELQIKVAYRFASHLHLEEEQEVNHNIHLGDFHVVAVGVVNTSFEVA